MLRIPSEQSMPAVGAHNRYRHNIPSSLIDIEAPSCLAERWRGHTRASASGLTFPAGNYMAAPLSVFKTRSRRKICVPWSSG